MCLSMNLFGFILFGVHELLGFVCPFLASNLTSFGPSFLKLISLPLSSLLFWDSHNAPTDQLAGISHVP